MSVQAHAWAKTVKTGSPTLKAVLVAIADYADPQGYGWPSQEQLAADTEFSLRAVRNALDGLESLGLLVRAPRRRSDGSRRSDGLTLQMGRDTNRHDVPPAGDQPAPRSDQPARRSKQPAPGAGLTTFEPSLNHQKNRSDADASGATGEPAVPFSVRDLLWSDGVLTLRGLGMADPAARRFIGKLLRETGGDAGRIHWAIDEARAAETGDPIPYVTRLLNDTPTDRRQPREPRPAYQPAPTGQAARLATLYRQRQERTHASDHGTRDFVVIEGARAGEPDDAGGGGEAGGRPALPAQADRRAPDPLQRVFQSRAEHAAAQAAVRRRRAP
ncbi:helix-turn-helix domain-containing protein [Methylobacterium sp.]|uniref:helix-turn-helix domain-containing protein n=1 Tax=Methylobacterium sp. TaxID=409 RepID=UPI0025D45A18|nr:helix-turn-helix domain-containing protein [Methylobacterium sp.]MBY0256224.1 helix-turn-helix domain-containing protein [Methylobacterium sp.]